MFQTKSKTPLLGALSKQQFLDQYWQKKPLLVRQAFPQFNVPVSNEELAGLACESEIESRLIIRDAQQKQPGDQWSVRHGPFTEADFAALPEQNWTLLVQDVDKWLPQAATLLESFRFIPDWRVDDLMISYAEDGGSVGAHWDDYDVFLIQGSGERRWMIDDKEADTSNILQGPPVRLLKDFRPTQEWLLQPGDMLYLPPRIPHHGVAVGGGCQTLSVGFRAPSEFELVEDFSQYLLEKMPAGRRYRDAIFNEHQHPAEITEAATRQFRTIIQQISDFSPETFQGWLGEYLTRPKPGITPMAREQSLDPEQLLVELAQSPYWKRDGASRFAFSRAPEGHIQLFVNGQPFDFSAQHTDFIEVLCLHHQLEAQVLSEAAARFPELTKVITDLINQGHLYPIDA